MKRLPVFINLISFSNLSSRQSYQFSRISSSFLIPLRLFLNVVLLGSLSILKFRLQSLLCQIIEELFLPQKTLACCFGSPKMLSDSQISRVRWNTKMKYKDEIENRKDEWDSLF